MVGWCQNRLEGRALEHGLVAVARGKLHRKHVFRARFIRMLHADGSVEKIDDPATLIKMQWYACRLAEGLGTLARFAVRYAEQTIRRGNQSISIDVRGIHLGKESWVELKWTRGALRVALASALQKSLVLQKIGKEFAEWKLDTHLGGHCIPQPGYVGGLAVSPDGWLLMLVDCMTHKKQQWSGFFEGGPAKTVPSKARVKPQPKPRNIFEKHKRYNTSAKGKARARRYKEDPEHKLSNRDYQAEYAKSNQDREIRAAARRRYRGKNPKPMKNTKRKRT